MDTTRSTENVQPGFMENLSSSELYHLLIENANDAILFMRLGRFADFNSKALQLFGATSRSQLLGLWPWELSPEFQPDGEPSTQRAMQFIAQATAGTPTRFYWKHKRIDGSLFDAEVSLHSFSIENTEYIQSIVRDITEYIQTRDALRESEQRYKRIFDNVQDVFYQTDAESRIVLASPSISNFSTFTVEELIGRPVGELYANPADREALLSKLKSEGHVDNYEVELISGSDTTFRATVSAHLIFDEKGQFSGIEGVLHDVTERYLALQKAESDRIMLRTLIDNLPHAVYVKNQLAQKIISNRADLEQIGVFDEAEVTGKTDLELFPGPVGEHGYSQDMEVINKGISIENEISKFNDREGKAQWISTTKVPLRDGEGKIIGLLGFCRNITADKLAGEALQRSEEKYRTLVESIPDGVYRTTPDGRFIEANKALVSILGYESKEDLFKIDIRKDLYFDIQDREAAVQAEKYSEMAVYPLRRKNGEKIWVEDHGWLKTDENGQVLYHEGVLRDITERHNLQVQLLKYTADLKQAIETKDKLFSIIAHDLVSPFNAMLGLTNLLCDKEVVFNEQEKNDILLRLKGVAGNTFNLLQNLLTWSRSQRGKINLEKTIFNPKEILLPVFDVLEEAAFTKNIRLVDELADTLQVFADKSLTHIVLYNLVANGVKFTPEGGVISVSGMQKGDFVEIRVKDTGIGITADRLPNLFVAGGSKSTPGTNNEKGTGLGLVLCKEFVEKQHGSIRVTSEPGKGSEFIFLLPARTSAP